MAAWLLVAGQIIGILVAGSGIDWPLGFAALAFGGLTCWAKRKVWLLVIPAFGIGLILGSLRLGMLPPVVDHYGQHHSLTVKYQAKLGQYLWQAQVLEPQELSGIHLRVRSDYQPAPGIYQVSGIIEPPVRFLNPDRVWHYKRQLYTGDQAYLFCHSPILISGTNQGFWSGLRSKYRQNIFTVFDDKTAPLALAISLGDRSNLDYQDRTYLTRSGAGHILALSGLHVSILAGAIFLALKKIVRQRLAAEAIVLTALVAFVLLAGPRPSLVRAVLMSGLGLAGFIFSGRSSTGTVTLAAAAFLMLTYNPLWLYDYAFVLSFSASGAGLIGGKVLAERLTCLPSGARPIAGYTLAIQLALLPLQCLIFGGVSLWSPLVNILILPVLPLVLLLVLVVGAVGGTATGAGAIAATLLAGISEVAGIFSQAPGWLTLPGSWFAALTAISVLFLTVMAGLPRRGLYLLLSLFIFLGRLNLLQQQFIWTLWVLDVGQGDSIIIKSPGGWTLVDCGDSTAGALAVVPALRYLGANNLTVIITHPHWDHVGGFEAVNRVFALDMLMVNQQHYHEFSRLLPDETPLWVMTQPSVRRGKMMIWSPRHFTTGTLSTNNQSLVASIALGGFDVLLSGDLEAEGEELLISKIQPHSILKVGHHGSPTSTSAAWLKVVSPEVAIISCGRRKNFDFPSPEVLSVLRDSGVEVFRTDRQGCVRIQIWPGVGCRVTSVAGGAKWQRITVFTENRLIKWIAGLGN